MKTKRSIKTAYIESHYKNPIINLHDIYHTLPLLIGYAQSNNHALLALISYCEMIESSYDSYAYQTPERLRRLACIPWRTFSFTQLFEKEPNTPQEKLYYSIALTSKIFPPSIKASINNSSEKPALMLLQESAQEDLGKALYYLGIHHKKEKKVKDSLECHKKAASLGYIPSIFEIGYSLLKKASNKNKQKKALNFIKKAADQNYATAYFYLGILYAGKIKKLKNLTDIPWAYIYYKKAAELGCLQAHHDIGILMLKNKKHDSLEGLEHLLYAAKENYPASQTYLGALFCSSWFINNIQTTGMQLIQSASLQHDYSSLCTKIIKKVKHNDEIYNANHSKAIKPCIFNDSLLDHQHK